MQIVADLKKMAEDVRDNGLMSEKAEMLVKKAHEVKLATIVTFANTLK